MKRDKTAPTEEIEIRPVTPYRWADLERLFGPRGACAGCWCMYWRRYHKDYESGKGNGNKRVLKRLVAERVPGVIGYLNGEPAGWCCVSPRDEFVRLEKSRILKPVDDAPVWSVVCFFVARAHRRTGLSVEMLRGAVDYAQRSGAKIVEGYPVDAEKRGVPAAFAWTGTQRAFEAAGFKECARRSPTRPIMRLKVA
ncbi:MAG: GNAT family N-acetyltransferase [Gammaproteobacteria bacterium]